MCELCNHSQELACHDARPCSAWVLITLSALHARAESHPTRRPQRTSTGPETPMDGNARYAANAPNERDFVGRAERVAVQYPIAAVLSCSDSRVSPELAFDQAPAMFSSCVSPAISSTTTACQFGIRRQDLGRAASRGA
jgi:hypothetical protein